jgi:hypothetical protein
MTQQIADCLWDQGELHPMSALPLEAYFAQKKLDPGFVAEWTSNWRGYHAEWELLDGRLYLVSLTGRLRDGSAASLSTFFPGAGQRVFARWFSGRMRMGQGEMLSPPSRERAAVYERQVSLYVIRGVVIWRRVRVRVRVNWLDKEFDDRGYPIAGWRQDLRKAWRELARRWGVKRLD